MLVCRFAVFVQVFQLAVVVTAVTAGRCEMVAYLLHARTQKDERKTSSNSTADVRNSSIVLHCEVVADPLHSD